jgi:hypothetical protein
MLIINSLNGNLKVSSEKNNNIDGKLITIDVVAIVRIGSASLYEEDYVTSSCKSISLVGHINKNLSDRSPFDLYLIEENQGYLVFDKETKVAYVSESLSYINNMVSTPESNLLETLISHGYVPEFILLNNLILRQPLDTLKLDTEANAIFDFQYGDNKQSMTLAGVVEVESLRNRIENNLFIKSGTLTSVCDFEVTYINPAKTVDDLNVNELGMIGSITLTNFKTDKAKFLLTPLLFKTTNQFKAFEETMKADGRKTVTISRPSIEGFCAQTVVHIPSKDEVINTDSTINKIVIFPTMTAPALLANEYE